jgi:hypothetical protein
MEDFHVRTQYDGKDLRQVVDIYYYDKSGKEVIHQQATQVCFNLTTCADMGNDMYDTLRMMIEGNLRAAKIPYSSVTMGDD